MIAALWGRLQGWLLTLAGALLVLVGAYAAGGRAAKRSAELDQARRQAAAKGKADAVAQKIDALDDPAIRDRAGKWVRHDGR
ncbi:hypothetical protein [Castellaniella caeni]|uniref:hypothetical protein n=1 Tax=Castellaniella caeni TaxID=266123 RepID=UPI0015E0E507|nr:hypothetical protein [Castellaniella caeni]